LSGRASDLRFIDFFPRCSKIDGSTGKGDCDAGAWQPVSRICNVYLSAGPFQQSLGDKETQAKAAAKSMGAANTVNLVL
jgi:hypothetical protein